MRGLRSRRARARARPKIVIALAGGGPLGGIYEIGALEHWLARHHAHVR